MFKTLHPLAQSSPIVMLLTAEGEHLRVTITQKQAKKGQPLSLSVLGSPAELDQDLAAAIESAAGVPDVTAAIAEQVRAQIANSKPAKLPAAKKAAATESTAATQSAATPAPKTPAPGTKAAKKQACIDLYVKLALAGKEISREAYIKAAGDRSFERIFKNWTEFKKAAERAVAKAKAAAEAAAAPAATPADKTLTLPGVPEAAAESTAAQSEGTTGTGLPEAGCIGRADAAESTERPAAPTVDNSKWPFPRTGRSPIAADPPAPQPVVWTVELTDGSPLFEGQRTRALERGATLSHLGVEYVALNVDAESRRCIVRRKFREVLLADGTKIGNELLDLQPGAEITLHGEAYVVDEVVEGSGNYIVRAKTPPTWSFEVEDGSASFDGTTSEPAVGEETEHAGQRYVVTEVYGSTHRAIVKPLIVRNVIDEDGNVLGKHTGDALEEGGTIAVGEREFSVTGWTKKAVFVEPVTVEV